jgi:tyrosyl-tRNA synthetase
VVELDDEEWRSPLEKRLVRCGLAESTSDARRKITQGGVRIDGEKAAIGAAPPAGDYLLQAGKLGAVRVRRIRTGIP